jgi:hypothetical protein
LILSDDLPEIVDAIRNGVVCGRAIERSVDAIAEKKAVGAGAVLVTSNDLAQVVNAVNIGVSCPWNVEDSVSAVTEKESVIDVVGVIAPNNLTEVIDAVCERKMRPRRNDRSVRPAA